MNPKGIIFAFLLSIVYIYADVPIVEENLIDIMYELPSLNNVEKCVITKDTIEKGAKPVYIEADRKSA